MRNLNAKPVKNEIVVDGLFGPGQKHETLGDWI